MNRKISTGLFFSLLLLPNFLFSEEILITKEGKIVLLKDNFTWEYVQDTKLTNIKYAEEAITIWDKALLRTDCDYKKAIGLFLHYQNNTDKKIIGILVKVSIINPFGKTVFTTTYEDEVLLEPNEKKKNDKYWIFSDNPFINNEPYDRMWQMADNGTAKITTNILKVIFSDGTILTSRPVNVKPRAKK